VDNFTFTKVDGSARYVPAVTTVEVVYSYFLASIKPGHSLKQWTLKKRAGGKFLCGENQYTEKNGVATVIPSHEVRMPFVSQQVYHVEQLTSTEPMHSGLWKFLKDSCMRQCEF
jgi:hypothetical protein